MDNTINSIGEVMYSLFSIATLFVSLRFFFMLSQVMSPYTVYLANSARGYSLLIYTVLFCVISFACFMCVSHFINPNSDMAENARLCCVLFVSLYVMTFAVAATRFSKESFD